MLPYSWAISARAVSTSSALAMGAALARWAVDLDVVASPDVRPPIRDAHVAVFALAAQRLGLDAEGSTTAPFQPFDAEMLTMVLEERPRVVTFHFGVPTGETVEALHSRDILIGVTATTREEAVAVERAACRLRDRRSGRKHLKNANRVFWVVFCVIVAVVGGKSLPSFVSLVGAALCVPLAVVFPPLFYLRLAPHDEFSYGALLLLIGGVVSWIVSTWVALAAWGK